MDNGKSRYEAALTGAVVADSAAMGLHWIYDIERIAQVGGESPEFLDPDATHYEGVVGVFAHGGRPVGSLTRYGATVQLAAEHLAGRNGRYNPPIAAASFLSAFGYGGSFIGYVDHPAAGALDRIRQRDGEIEASFRSLTDRIPFHSIIALGPHIQSIASDREVGDAEARIAEVLRGYPDIDLDSEQMALIVGKIDDLHLRYWEPTGVSDLQLPVLASVIPVALAATRLGFSDDDLLESIRSAANLTHVDEDAIKVGNFVGFLIRDLLSEVGLKSAIEAQMHRLPGELSEILSAALSRPWNSGVEAAGELGMSCALAEGLPLSLVILLKAENFTDAVRTNILCGGDSCGRGILVGALGGLLWGSGGSEGIPEEWINRVLTRDEVRRAAHVIATAT
jgi:hypothetical protein